MIGDELNISDAVLAQAPSANMAEVSIRVRDVGKMYRIFDRPQDRLKQMLWRGRRMYGREFWALQHVSFDVHKGETLGIIGHNGSGKSTLLQIIAGTLAPSTGNVEVTGRVAALLELGSGFNPEFTGRENIYMNGAILGFSRQEMDARFGEIVAFADIGDFIEQPVKVYSSGMVVRLAFAVQVFVSKQVLIVDEALAVGDEAFQRKCMAAIREFQESGGTVLLVTHSTQTIVRHCSRCMLLDHGQVVTIDESKLVCDLYQKLISSDGQTARNIVALIRQQGLRNVLHSTAEAIGPEAPQPSLEALQPSEELSADWFDTSMPKTSEVTYGNRQAEIADFAIFDQYGARVNVLTSSRRYAFVYHVRFDYDADDVQFGMMLKTVDGLDVAGISSDLERLVFRSIKKSSVVRVSFNLTLNLAPGTYFLNTGVGARVNGEQVYLHRRVDMCMIRVVPPDRRGIYGLAYLDPQISADVVLDKAS
jgi:lipopolysaccharide transport system ATP-binding protein